MLRRHLRGAGAVQSCDGARAQPNRYADEVTTLVGGGKGLTVCLCKRSHEGERFTKQLCHNTISTAHEYNGTQPTSKTYAACLPYHAGLCCKRCIAILSALRACESSSTANPQRDQKKKVFFSRRNNVETTIISASLDVLKQYFSTLVKTGLQLVHKVLTIGRK